MYTNSPRYEALQLTPRDIVPVMSRHGLCSTIISLDRAIASPTVVAEQTI